MFDIKKWPCFDFEKIFIYSLNYTTFIMTVNKCLVYVYIKLTFVFNVFSRKTNIMQTKMLLDFLLKYSKNLSVFWLKILRKF